MRRNAAILGDNENVLPKLADGTLTGEPVVADVIYIDPPYNRGVDIYGYKNAWSGYSAKGRRWAGKSGRFLDFMEPRLVEGRRILSDDGMILVSICDMEHARLKILMDQIFGPDNFVANLVWNKGQGLPGKIVTRVHEYILVYAKDRERCRPLKRKRKGVDLMLAKAAKLKRLGIVHAEAQRQFRSWMGKNKGDVAGCLEYTRLHPETYIPYRGDPMNDNARRPALDDYIPLHPITGKQIKMPAGRSLRLAKETFLQRTQCKKILRNGDDTIQGDIIFGKDESKVIRILETLEKRQRYATLTVLRESHKLTKREEKYKRDFSTPKPLALIKRILECVEDPSATVLDFFAGSGTTGHAVHELNKEDAGSRRWIMVEKDPRTFNDVLVPRMNEIGSDYLIGNTASWGRLL